MVLAGKKAQHFALREILLIQRLDAAGFRPEVERTTIVEKNDVVARAESKTLVLSEVLRTNAEGAFQNRVGAEHGRESETSKPRIRQTVGPGARERNRIV